MLITYSKGLFRAHDVVDGIEMEALGWRFLSGQKVYVTANALNASRFREYADDVAKQALIQYGDAFYAAVARSNALDANIIIPAPPGLAYRPYQKAGIAYAKDLPRVLIGDSMRLGKEQPLDSKILTPDGWVRMGDAYVGMQIIGRDGKTHAVTGVYPQGVRAAYRVMLFDGSSTLCGREHLFTYKTCRGGETTKTVGEMMDSGLTYPSSAAHYKYVLPTMACAEFTPRIMPIDPYLLGILIGDGYLSGSSICFSAGDNKTEIKERVERIIAPTAHLAICSGGSCPQWALRHTAWRSSPTKTAITAMGLNVKSKERFIPREYLFASSADRLELLRGLMDTDGSCRDNRSTFHTCSLRLADDVAHLVRSLGGLASVCVYDRAAENKPVEYRVRVNLDVCPFHLTYKSTQWRKPTQKRGKAIVSIEYIGDVEQQCISTSAPDQLYVTDDFIVTHNTIQAIGVMNTKPDLKDALIVCPATAKYNWKRELEKWLVHEDTSVGVVEGNKWPDTSVVIINYDLLSRHKDILTDAPWDVAIFDECHALKNPTAARTKIVYGYKREPRIQAHQKLFLSGTALFKSPIDLWTICKECDPKGLGADWLKFVYRYCAAKKGRFGLDTSGASNLEELQFRMRSKFMVRREKWDVAAEIEPKRETILLPEAGLEAIVRREAKVVRNELGDFAALLNGVLDEDAVDKIVNRYSRFDGVQRDDDEDSLAEHLATVRRELALAKLPMCVEHLKGLLEDEPKIVVFAHHRDVIDALRAEFPNAAVVYGGMTAKSKDEQIIRFQTDPTCSVFIGNIVAAGQAIDLSMANVVAFIELSWVPSEMDQAEERVWAVGKTEMNWIYRYVVEDSLDERMVAILDRRQRNVHKAMNIAALNLEANHVDADGNG